MPEGTQGLPHQTDARRCRGLQEASGLLVVSSVYSAQQFLAAAVSGVASWSKIQ